ncbi:hypothetical protein RDV89_09425 [Nocardioides zeae]|uniref:Uncharacterized protein n=1 Tax=Nocardioides imazamoxiresistens TaxID=3231893 RepID=A0ABU3PWM7_9ACTN|nr:hypothetical protein [Nocardioides zeae]MDT9593286.1 hypothetical protein [Nocardioides zeae]
MSEHEQPGTPPDEVDPDATPREDLPPQDPEAHQPGGPEDPAGTPGLGGTIAGQESGFPVADGRTYPEDDERA